MADRRMPTVTQGGMWNSAKVNYSKETQNLLKEMMKESKLTNFQQRQLNNTMKDGGTLPTSCNPTTSAKPRAPRSSGKQKVPKVLNPKNHSAQPRTREAIEASGAYDREKFIPQAPSFYDKDKARLVNMMAYGEDIAPPDKSKFTRPPPPPEPEIDRFDELLSEIEERRQFLDEMEGLGKGAKFRSIIETEISQKIREMEIVDKKRSTELEKRIQAEELKKKREREKNDPLVQSEET